MGVLPGTLNIESNIMYIVLSLSNLSVEIYTTKIRVADRVKCHRNTLKGSWNCKVINGFRITRADVNGIANKEL